MSTIASPRPSITLSSRRTSTSSANTITSAALSTTASLAAERGSLRRNRNALRDYYNLNPSDAASSIATPTSAPQTPTLDPDQDSELDKPGFDPESYVQHLLSQEGLEGVLRVEAGLVSDIRSLDGEKKALVYDNYSKLIAATDTIRKMRETMDPVGTPGSSTLGPAIGRIAEMSQGLVDDSRRADGGGRDGGRAREREREREVVRWVLDAPERIGRLAEEGREDEAKSEWRRVDANLGKWKGVKGTEEVRRKCLEALEKAEVG